MSLPKIKLANKKAKREARRRDKRRNEAEAKLKAKIRHNKMRAMMIQGRREHLASRHKTNNYVRRLEDELTNG